MILRYAWGFLQGKHRAPDVERRGGGARYDVADALTALKIGAKILIQRLSVTVTIHHLAHGGVASAGRVATFPKPVGPMEAGLPRLPSDVTIARVRRGAASGDAKKRDRIYTVRRKRGTDAIRWLNGGNPYYADVVFAPSRLAYIVGGAETPGARDMDPGRECLPDDMGPAPDQVVPVGEVSEAAFETGGDAPPRNSTGQPVGCAEGARFRSFPGRSGGKHVAPPMA